MERLAREREERAAFADIGARLREERRRRGISQRDLAHRLGLSPSLISQIETGRSKPSVSTLYAIVTELGISLDRLFHPHPEAGEPGPAGTGAGGPVVRPGERAALELESGVRWERLTADEEDVDFLYVVYDVGGSSSSEATLMRHQGREYGYVISGRLGVQIGFREHVLEPGDAIAFDSTQPHRLWNAGDRPAHAIWFVVGRSG
ncbi:MAG TPA: XRE family transcriptional regulator [Actinomycetota bacterium]|nr:XRE family transcriptional regulator [Actinomycetota bacterium]